MKAAEEYNLLLHRHDVLRFLQECLRACFPHLELMVGVASAAAAAAAAVAASHSQLSEAKQSGEVGWTVIDWGPETWAN